jgi:hypothetical protein
MIPTCGNPHCGNEFDRSPTRLHAIAVQNSTSYMLVWICDDCSRSLGSEANGVFSPLIAPRNDASIQAYA